MRRGVVFGSLGIRTQTYSNEALAFFARCDPQPATLLKDLYDKTFRDAVQSGWFQKGDIFYIRMGQTAQMSLLNLIQDAYNTTNVNSCTFTAKQGFTASLTGQLLNNNIVQSHYVKSAYPADMTESMMLYNVPTALRTQWINGNRDYLSNYGASMRWYDYHAAGAYLSLPAAVTNDMWTMVSNTVTRRDAYKNGVYYTNRDVANLATDDSGTREIVGANGSSVGVRFSFKGAKLTVQQILDQYNSIEYFRLNVGGTF